MEITAHSVEGTDLFVHRLGDFYRSGVFSDLTIRTQDQDLKVHKLIVCSRSETFCRIFNENFDSVHDVPNVTLDLTEENARAVQAMIRSFYGLQYDKFNLFYKEMCPMLLNVEVYAIADKYEVEYLKIQSKLNFANQVHEHWNSKKFFDVIRSAYRSTPSSDRGLRDVIVAICQENKMRLRELQGFEELLQEIPSFASDLVLVNKQWLPACVTEEPVIVDFYTCLSCRAKWQIRWWDAVRFNHCPFCQDDKILPF